MENISESARQYDHKLRQEGKALLYGLGAIMAFGVLGVALGLLIS